MDSAFPGTNPWERLGVGPAAATSIMAERQQKTQRRNVDKQVDTQRSVVGVQTGAQVQVAKIHARSAAATTAVASGTPGDAKRYGDYASEGTDPGIRGPSATGVQAQAAKTTSIANELNSWTKDFESKLRSKELDVKVGQMAHSPEIAALKRMAVTAWELGELDSTMVPIFQKHMNKLRAAGLAAHAVKEVGKLFNDFLGSLRQKGRGGSKTSARTRPPRHVQQKQGNYAPATPQNKAFNQRLRRHRGVTD